MSDTYLIADQNTNRFINKMAELNKKAEKLNLPEIKYSIGKAFINSAVKMAYRKVTINGESPLIDGWMFVAKIEYLEVGEVVSSPFSAFACPSVYRNTKPLCEHCNTHKVKRYTFLISNAETGELKNVGKTCLKDFLGPDIEAIASRFSWICDVINELEDEEGEYREGEGELHKELRNIVRYASYFVLKEGFKPSSEMEESTRHAVISSICNPRCYFKIKNNDPCLAYADEVIKYIASSDCDSEFMLNCANLFDCVYVPIKMVGYICGAVGAYAKQLLKDIEKRDLVNEHFGKEKVRSEMTLKLVRINDFDHTYGTTFVHGFLDEAGRTAVWFGSKRLRDENKDLIEVGSKVVVKATIKGHDEYKGTKQTLITRVSLLWRF